MPVAPKNARAPMRPRVSRADAPPARVRRASAKTHAPSAKTIAAVDLARVGSGTLSSRPYVHKINNCNVCTYNVILITRLIVRPTVTTPATRVATPASLGPLDIFRIVHQLL